MKLIYNAIIGGKFYVAGEPIERSMVPPGLRKYEAIDEEATGTGSISLSRKYNQVYSVDDEGRMSRPIRRQIAQMQIEAERNDALEEEVADAPLDETTAAALEKAQEDYAAGVEQQKANARIAAEHADEAENAICEEHDLAAEKGEFDEYDSDPRPKPKPPPSRKLFVKRQGKFLPISTVYPLPGETLYRHRKRGFGVTEKFIKHSVFKEESNNE
jgi:hypothetical protein